MKDQETAIEGYRKIGGSQGNMLFLKCKINVKSSN